MGNNIVMSVSMTLNSLASGESDFVKDIAFKVDMMKLDCFGMYNDGYATRLIKLFENKAFLRNLLAKRMSEKLSEEVFKQEFSFRVYEVENGRTHSPTALFKVTAFCSRSVRPYLCYQENGIDHIEVTKVMRMISDELAVQLERIAEEFKTTDAFMSEDGI